MPPTLKVEISHLNDVAVIRLAGEARLDVEDAAFQLDRVVALHPRTIVVDTSQLTFLSSIGMSLFINLWRTAARNAGVVKLVGLQPQVRDAMAHARLLELFELHSDMSTALAENKPALA